MNSNQIVCLIQGHAFPLLVMFEAAISLAGCAPFHRSRYIRKHNPKRTRSPRGVLDCPSEFQSFLVQKVTPHRATIIISGGSLTMD